VKSRVHSLSLSSLTITNFVLKYKVNSFSRKHAHVSMLTSVIPRTIQSVHTATHEFGICLKLLKFQEIKLFNYVEFIAASGENTEYWRSMIFAVMRLHVLY
jgi:hypothetical protein